VSGSAAKVTADAGPDQTVPGPSPVMVSFDATPDDSNYRCEWRNQWNHLRSSECDTSFEVSFGRKNPKVGTKRHFTLLVWDTNNTSKNQKPARDKVTITLGKTQGAEDPLDSSAFANLTTYSFEEVGASDLQHIDIAFLEGNRFYIRSNSTQLTPAAVKCHNTLAEHWSAAEGRGSAEGSTVEGCIGDRDFFDSEIIGITPRYEGEVITSWYVWSGAETPAEITPEPGRSYRLRWAATSLGQN
jgi:hypothetical protein